MPMLKAAQEILQKYYGYKSFRAGQQEIIESILSQRDTFAVMPTGAGKSVCYQIPALLLPGITLVISPLISLMKDQVDALNGIGIPAAYINSSLGYDQVDEILNAAESGKIKILYIAPERLKSRRFEELITSLEVSLIAVDEAHCVSQWGHDFRPSYRLITPFIESFSQRPPVSAFTATATNEVSKDVVDLLGLKRPSIFVTGFNRDNLYFGVIRGEDKRDFVLEYIKAKGEAAGIIYAATRKEVDALHAYLVKKGYSAGRYHAGMEAEERKNSQDAFLYDDVQIMIATNAFGMGIDKSNIRFVIHYNMPKNLEAYYQEAGRAGRDGATSECILLYGPRDVSLQKFLIEQSTLLEEKKDYEYKKLQAMVDYCYTSQCLRKYILHYFGETNTPENCTNCSTCSQDLEYQDITIQAQKIISCVVRMKERYGISLVAKVLKGSSSQEIIKLGFETLSTYGLMSKHTIKEIKELISYLVAENFLEITGGQYPIVKLQQKAVSAIKKREQVFRPVRKKDDKRTPDNQLFDLLRLARKDIAAREQIPPYIVFSDSTLQEMTKICPVDRNTFLTVKGVGEVKLERYGNEFMEVIKQYLAQ